MRSTTSSRIKDERGASLVEYALLVALIAVVCIAAVTFLGGSASSKVNGAGTAIEGDPYAGWNCVYDAHAGGHQFQKIGQPPSNVFPGPCP